MRKLLISGGVLLGFAVDAIGQRLADMTNFPVTPQASAIFKSIAAPVSYYTGQPNVSIPLYTISQDGVEVPIILSFNTSGIFVTEEATSLGIGVSLSWGGSIVRSTNGQADERGFFSEAYKMGDLKQELVKNYGITSPAIWWPYNNTSSFAMEIDRESEYAAINTYNDPYAHGTGGISTDLRPDDFHYNVLDKSGLFKFNQTNRTFITFPLDDIKINKTMALTSSRIQNFEITKSDGVKVILGDDAIESSTKYNTSVYSNYNQIVDQSWFIKKVTTVKNSTIDFTYVENSYDHNTDDRTMTYVPEKQYSTYEEHYILGDAYSTNEKHIKTISFKEGKLDFVYISDRTDCASPRLSQIILSDINNKKLKTFQFYHSYFIGNSPVAGFESSIYNNRLRLDSFVIQDNVSQSIQKYKFEYNTNAVIPSKRPVSRDWWGYYNGASTNKCINSGVNQIFTIKKIIFPTGGDRQYNLEDNQVPWDNQYMAKLREVSKEWFDPYSSNHLVINGSTLYNPFGSSNQTSSGAFVLSGSPPYDNIRTIYGDEYTIQGPTNVNSDSIILSGNTTFIHPEITPSQLNQWAYKVEIGIQQKIGGVFSDAYYFTISRYQSSPTILPNNNFHFVIPSIANGTYRIFVRMTSPPNYIITNNYSQHTDAVLTYQKSNLNNFKVGGLRVKEVIDQENLNQYKTTYEYVGMNNYGSGKLVTAPEYKEYVLQHVIVPGGMIDEGGFPETQQYNGYRVSSEPIFPLLKSQGSNVGYTNVIKKQIGGTEEIKEEFTFNFTPSFRNGYMKEYFQETEPKSWQSGKLLSSKKYKANALVSEDIFDYYGLSNETDKGFVDEINTSITTADLSSYDLQVDRRYDFPPIFYMGISTRPSPILYAGDNLTYYLWVDNNNPNNNVALPLAPATKIPYFKTYTGFDKLKSRTTNSYDGTNIITQTENYYYDGLPANLGLSRTETVNSKNQALVSKFYYPQDLVSESLMPQMIAANRTGAPIKTEKYKSGVKQFEEKFVFSKDASTGNLLLPKYVYASNFPNTNPNIINPPVGQLEKKVTYDQFDVKGNLLQYHEENNFITTMIWGYNKLYPVAKIIGADYASVIALVNQAVLDNPLSTDAQMRTELDKIRIGLTSTKAQVKTYTYAPLVGITSETDPNGRVTYYEYDNFQRLLRIRDQDNNILKIFDYKYQQ